MFLTSTCAMALLVSSASAQTLAWGWKVGEPVLYHAEITRESADGDWYFAAQNLEARAEQTTLVVDMSCQAVENLGKRWDMECRFFNAQISGTAFAGEQEPLSAIFEEYERYLEGSWAGFEMTSVGRLRSFDLHAIEASNEREGVVAEALRQLLMRPFAQLELELPKGGEAGDKAWKQGGTPVISQLRSSYGTTGKVVIKHHVVSVDGDVAKLETEGRGTVAYGLSMEADGTRTIAVDLAGAASFDLACGVLLQRESMVVGRFTAGASYSAPNDHYREVGSLVRIDAIPQALATPPQPEPSPEQPAEQAVPE